MQSPHLSRQLGPKAKNCIILVCLSLMPGGLSDDAVCVSSALI